MRLLPILFILSACAFKNPPERPIQEEGVQSITVSWRSDQEYSVKRFLTRANDGYTVDAPITLSAPVPWNLSIEGSLPLSDNTYAESVEAHASGKTYSLAASLKGSRLEISGLRTVLEEGKNQRAIIVMRARDAKSGGSPWILRLTLLSLPVAIEIEPLSPQTLPNLRRFDSPNLRLDLLKVVRIKNPEDLPWELSVHGRWLPGRLSRRFTTHQIYRIDKCRTDYLASDFTEEYITDFALLPLDENLPSIWINRLFDRGKLFRIGPKEDLLLGLYGSGKELAGFLDQGVPAVTPEEKAVPIACHQGDCIPELHRCPDVIETAKMKTGLEGHEVRISFEDNAHQGFLRYGHSSASDDPAGKAFELFPIDQTLF